MWVEYGDPKRRDLCIRIVDDELGHPWLRYKGQTGDGGYCMVGRPGDPTLSSLRAPKMRYREGLPADWRYDDIDAAYYDPVARRDSLDGWGVDQCVLFPQWGLEYERLFFENDLEGHRVNMAAWNRWAVEVAQQGHGRLHPVGHVSLQGDLDWLKDQLRVLAAGGVRLALFTPGLVNGKRMSHPDVDDAWHAFVDNGITVTFHVTAGVPRFLPAAWTDNDHDLIRAVELPFMIAGVPLALGDLAINGVLQRNPDLRIALVEVGAASWIRQYLPQFDMGYASNEMFSGYSVNPSLELRPSEYILRHCRIAAFPAEDPVAAAQQFGDLFCFGSDWPHPEGVAEPVKDYQAIAGVPHDALAAAKLYRDNSAWLLHMT
jgi:predicted TIM-barrel fold metal-dependent hydrolase